MQPQQFAYAIGAMLKCALWSSVDIDSGEPLDKDHGVQDFRVDATVSLIGDLHDFVTANAADLAASGLSAEQVGHDFWLTRNGHGAGFWDRGIGEVGERLTAACRPYGSVDLWVDADGGVNV